MCQFYFTQICGGEVGGKVIKHLVVNYDNLVPMNGNCLYAFIDASNLWEAQKARGKMFDYLKLKDFLKTKFGVSKIEIYYYTAYPADGTRDYSLDKKHKFFTYLKKALGYKVRKKELKRIVVHKEKGDLKKYLK